MPGLKPEILHFGPTDETRSPLAEYSRRYVAALRLENRLNARPMLDETIPERLEGMDHAFYVVRNRVKKLMRDTGAMENQILHVELDRITHREYWAAYNAARMRPNTPLVALFHDPPELTPPLQSLKSAKPENETDRKKRNPFAKACDAIAGALTDRPLTAISGVLSDYGQRGIVEHFLNRLTVFASLSERGCTLLSERYPHRRGRIAHVPPVCLGGIPEDLEPNERTSASPLQVTVFGEVDREKSYADLVDALAVIHRQASLRGRMRVLVRGPLGPSCGAQKHAEETVEYIRKSKLQWLIDFQARPLGEREINNLLLETDVLILPYAAGACNGASMDLLRCQAWAVAVVAADVGCLSEMIGDGKEGLLYPAGDVEALARSLMHLVNTPEERAAMARALRARTLRYQSPERVNRAVESLYQEVLAAHREERPLRMPEVMRIPSIDYDMLYDFEAQRLDAGRKPSLGVAQGRSAIGHADEETPGAKNAVQEPAAGRPAGRGGRVNRTIADEDRSNAR